jgi:1-acyl-sn-glycerol-3-phosphate acyltransferase
MSSLIHVDSRYEFVPPHRGMFWPRVFRSLAPWYLRRKYGVQSVEVRNADVLSDLQRTGQGVLLAPNHCRMSDAVVLQSLATAVKQPFFVMASSHLFRASRLTSWALRRMGAFSIYREGIDRQAVEQGIEILARAERPLVIFPEGALSSANDCLNELQEGVSFIARAAATRIQRQETDPATDTPSAKSRTSRQLATGVSLLPVAIRYVFEGDVEAAAGRILNGIEQRLSWAPQHHRPLLDRILRTGSALLTLKEVEFLGKPSAGTLAERQQLLIEHLLQPAENEWLKKPGSGSVITRVRDLRRAIVAEMVDGQLSSHEMNRRWTQLRHAELAQALSLYPADYVASRPTAERILETVERFHEHLTGESLCSGPLRAIIEVGQPLPVSARRERSADGDPLLNRLSGSLRQLLHKSLDECRLAPRQHQLHDRHSCPSTITP